MRLIPYTQRDLLEYASITRRRLTDGAMTVDKLCDTIVRNSNNSAANLLLASVGDSAGG